MRYRTAFITTAIAVAFMFVLQWCVVAAAKRAITTGWELPVWFRFLLNVAALWMHFWWLATFLLLVVLVAIASLTSALRQKK
jgi:hypothetical protein